MFKCQYLSLSKQTIVYGMRSLQSLEECLTCKSRVFICLFISDLVLASIPLSFFLEVLYEKYH